MLWKLKMRNFDDNCENSCAAYNYCFSYDDTNYKKALLKEFSKTCEEKDSVFEYLPVELLKGEEVLKMFKGFKKTKTGTIYQIRNNEIFKANCALKFVCDKCELNEGRLKDMPCVELSYSVFVIFSERRF